MRRISLYPSLSVFLVAERTDLCLSWGANSGTLVQFHWLELDVCIRKGNCNGTAL